MIFRVGIENNNDGRTIVWALEYPGCFAYGQDSREAQMSFLQVARDYAAWIAHHGESWLEDDKVELIVEETFDVYFVDDTFERIAAGEGSMVESFFSHDWKPLDAADIGHAWKLLTWSREDLLDIVKGLSAEKLNQPYPNERWSIKRYP